jgi:hypothetical protein
MRAFPHHRRQVWPDVAHRPIPDPFPPANNQHAERTIGLRLLGKPATACHRQEGIKQQIVAVKEDGC